MARARLTDSVVSLLRPVRQCALGEERPASRRRSWSGRRASRPRCCSADPRTAEVYTAPVSLRVHPTTDIAEALQRALTRAPAQRFDPVLCTDPSGHVLGLLRLEDLASAARAAR